MSHYLLCKNSQYQTSISHSSTCTNNYNQTFIRAVIAIVTLAIKNSHYHARKAIH